MQIKGTVKYEADSEGSLLVLLNISLSQDMIDEGVSREVVNRVQKLKKKAKLVVTDEVTVFYQVFYS
jgi:isoleucyl-tRNA synthetase